jgi:hypothetical protein
MRREIERIKGEAGSRCADRGDEERERERER